MNEQLKSLLNTINAFENKDVSAEKLSQITLSIISLDDFDRLPQELQDAIYTLDNKELNGLSKQEILEIKAQIQHHTTS